MRTITVAFSLAALAAVFILPSVAAESHPMGTASGWFDFENCAFCRNLMKDPGLLPHTTWEVLPIAKGVAQVITVEPEYSAAMAEAGAAMEKLGQDIQTGKVNPMATEMCGHCQEFGMILMAGVHTETIKAQAAEVTLFTSEDPALVERMHAMAKRDAEELKEMMAQH